MPLISIVKSHHLIFLFPCFSVNLCNIKPSFTIFNTVYASLTLQVHVYIYNAMKSLFHWWHILPAKAPEKSSL